MHTDTLPEGDDELRTLVSAILSGGYKEEIYLSDVASICTRKPDCAGALRELIDRYHRLGRMPLTQHQRIRAKIEQAEAVRAPAAAPRPGEKPRPGASQPVQRVPNARGDGYPFEDLTCDLSSEPLLVPTSRTHLPERARAAEGLVDLTPTLESPPPPPRSAMPARAAFAATRAAAVAKRALEPSASKTIALPKDAAAPAAKATPIPASLAASSPAPNCPSNPAPLLAPGPAAIALPLVARSAESSAAPAAAPAPLPFPFVEPAALLRPKPVPGPTAQAAALPASIIGVGRVLCDRYELQALLGRGGMACVYRALDRDRVRLGLADHCIAVKIVEANNSPPSAQAALVQEFQSAQRLSHPNVVNVFDIDQDEDATFYSMELLAGARLSQVLRRVDGSVLQRRYALAIIREIGAAVAHAHSRGVVHADLKPSNVMITLAGEVRVLDFGGLSMPPREPWLSDGDEDAYHHATPAYASCEQLERRRADPRDDIYALACIAYLLLAGRHPFDYLSSIEARARGLRARRPAGMPLAQWRVLRRGLSWGREQQTMSIDLWLQRLGLNGAARSLPPLEDLMAAVAAPRAWPRVAAWALPLLAASAAGVWALQSHADMAWEQTLAAAVTDAQQAVHEAWQAIASFGGDSDSQAPAPPHAAPPSVSATLTPSSRAAAAPAGADATAPAPTSRAAAAPAGAAAAPAHATAPHVAFAAQNYAVAAGDPAARIVIQRVGDTHGELSFLWWTESASAEPDVDYAALGVRTERMASGQDKLTVFVPIISNPLRTRPTQFRIALADAASHRGDGSATAPSTRATVTIQGGG